MKFTLLKTKLSRAAAVVALCGMALAFPSKSNAQASFTINGDTMGSFLSANAPTLNYGGAGTFAIAPASAPKGEFDSVLMFNTAAAVANFNGLYGIGNWAITGLSLSLASNFPTQGESISNPIFNNINGGTFGIDWIANNSWNGGNGGGMGGAGFPNTNFVSFDYIPFLLTNGVDSLGTYTYTPPGNQNHLTYDLPLDDNLVNGSAAGGNVSFYFYAPTNSQVSYLFNSTHFNSNLPEFTLDAASIPEPATLALLTTAFSGLWVVRRKMKS
jgi:hypothetical protein